MACGSLLTINVFQDLNRLVASLLLKNDIYRFAARSNKPVKLSTCVKSLAFLAV